MALLSLSLLLLPVGAVRAAGDCHWIGTVQIENDTFSGTDEHYTHGTRLSAISPVLGGTGAEACTESLRWTVRLAAALLPEGHIRAGFALGQSIFTPQKISEPDLIPDDRPYAGWLHGGIALVSETPARSYAVTLDIGIVGPASLAGDVQKTWHKWFGLTRPRGWRNQLRNEPGLVLAYEAKWRVLEKPLTGRIGYDLIPDVRLSAGNVLTEASAGLLFRIGSRLEADLGPPRAQHGFPGTPFRAARGVRSWYVFGKAEIRAVARNIFLDGNSFRASHSVDKEPLIGELQSGVALILGRWRLLYSHVLRTQEFDAQGNGDRFGSISLSRAF